MRPALRKGTINFETFNYNILVHNMLDHGTLQCTVVYMYCTVFRFVFV